MCVMFAKHKDLTLNTSEHLTLAQNRTSNLLNILKTQTVRSTSNMNKIKNNTTYCNAIRIYIRTILSENT